MTAMPMTFDERQSEGNQTARPAPRRRADNATAQGQDRQGSPPIPGQEPGVDRSRPDEAYLRLMADFENYKRHAERRIGEAQEEGADDLVRRLAPIIADLEKAARASGQDAESLRQGVEMVARKLANMLNALGYERIDTIGRILDPTIHEAVASLPAPQKALGTILAETSPGFLRNGKLVTPAKVLVAGPAQETSDNAGRR